LGLYIFRGLRMNDNALILAGALPAAGIALLADLALGWLEKQFKPGNGVRAWRQALAVATACMMAFGAWTWFTPRQAADRVVIGAKDFTEQLILGELLAQTIEAKTKLPVERRFDLGGNLAHQALISGEIDAYVEYTGTALMAILHHAPETDPRAVLGDVQKGYAPLGLTWMPPLGFNDTFAILVRSEDAQKYHLKRISDAAAIAPQWRAGFGQDFMSRPDGYTGFAHAYGLGFHDRPREMDLALTYRALKEHDVDLIAGNATDGLITRYGLVQLEDDRHYFPPYDAAPVVRQALLDKHPEVREAIASLAGKLTVDAMRKLNYAVDGEHREARAVVAEYLHQQGLN
jgi:osmoprotectant transport system permease protein